MTGGCPVLGTPGSASVGTTITWGGGVGPAPAGAVGTICDRLVGMGVGVGGTEAWVGVGTGGLVGCTTFVPPGVTLTGGAMMDVAVPGGCGTPGATVRLM